MKRIFVLIVLMLAGRLLYAQDMLAGNTQSENKVHNTSNEVLKISLKEAIEIAKKSNKDIQLSRYDVRKADAQIGEARSGAFPQISLSSQYTRNIEPAVMFIPPNTPGLNPTPNTSKFRIGMYNGYTAGLSLQQTLFSPKLNTAIKIAKDYSSYSDKNYDAVEEDVVLQVKKAFYGALLARDVIDVNKQGVALAKANFENLSSMYKQGMASEFDVLRAEVQLSNTEPGLIQAENNFILAKNGLKNLLGMDINDEIELSGVLTLQELPKDVVENESRKILLNNSSLQSLRMLEEIYSKNVSIQKADYFPSLAAFATYQYQTQDNTYKFNNYKWAKNFLVGLQISVPIFNGLQTTYKTEQARIDRDKISIQREKLEDGLTIQLDNVILRMNEAKKRINAQLKSVEQATKAVSISEVRFKNGVGTQLELIDAQVALSRTQINKLQSVYDYLGARAEWEYLIGYEEE